MITIIFIMCIISIIMALIEDDLNKKLNNLALLIFYGMLIILNM